MKNIIKGIKSTTGKVLLSSFLLICILATKGGHNSNAQASALSKNQQTESTSNATTIKPDHIDRTCNIIPTLPTLKAHEHIEFMRCKYVEYSKDANTYNLVLANTNNQTGKEYKIKLFITKFNKQLLQELHNFFYNQIVITTLNNSNTVTDFQLLDSEFSGEQLDSTGVYECIQQCIINKLKLDINILE